MAWVSGIAAAAGGNPKPVFSFSFKLSFSFPPEWHDDHRFISCSKVVSRVVKWYLVYKVVSRVVNWYLVYKVVSRVSSVIGAC
jgi:hypothetical protein